MTPVTVDIILISYNTATYTLRALRSVYEETHQLNYNIIVVDNNSQDDSVKQIRSHFPNVKLIESNQNLGFAGGVNLGANQAKGDYILLLNPDTVILDGAIDKLVIFAEKHPEQGIWGGITLNDDLSINTHNAWAAENILTLLFSAMGLNRLFNKSCFFNHANYGCWDRKTESEVDILQGSFFLVASKLWKTLGGLDETFFMYAEEADFCYRAKKLGYQPIVTPTAKIIHHGGGSEKNLSGKMIKLLTGKVTFINKHHSHIKQPVMKGLLLLYVVNKLLFSSLNMLMNKNKRTVQQEWWKIVKSSPSWLGGYS